MKYKNLSIILFILCFLINNVSLATTKDKVADNPKYINEINMLLDKNDYKNADYAIYSAMIQNPSNNDLQILSAISFIMQNKLDSAQDILDSVKKLSLSNANYYYAQGAIYLKRIDSSDMRFRNKRTELIQLAINQLKYSLKIDNNNARVYNALGVAELKRDNIYNAQTYFEKAVKINPSYATALDNLGSIYYITNDIDNAQIYYKKAAILNPLSSTVNYHLAQIYLKNDDLNKALYYANKSLQISKKSTYAYNIIGEVYLKQGNEAAAITSFKKAIYAMPENPDPYCNLAKIYESRGDVNSAIEQLRTCYTIIPDCDLVKLNLADLTLSLGQYEQAIKYYSQLSCKMKKESIDGIVSAYYSLATETANKSILKSQSRLADAMVYINNAIKENPDNLELYLTKSKLEKLYSNNNSSEEALVKLISSPNNSIADVFAKGEAYVALNQYRDARNLYAYLANQDRDIKSDLYLAEYFTYHKQYEPALIILKRILSKEPDNVNALMNVSFIDKRIALSDKNYQKAVYLKKHHDKFFEKEYLYKSIKFNPYNVDANILLASILVKDKEFVAANNCYKVALGYLDDEKSAKKIAKKSKKLENKINKIELKTQNNKNTIQEKV